MSILAAFAIWASCGIVAIVLYLLIMGALHQSNTKPSMIGLTILGLMGPFGIVIVFVSMALNLINS